MQDKVKKQSFSIKKTTVAEQLFSFFMRHKSQQIFTKEHKGFIVTKKNVSGILRIWKDFWKVKN